MDGREWDGTSNDILFHHAKHQLDPESCVLKVYG